MVKFVVFSTKVMAVATAALLFTSCHTSIDLGNGIDGDGNVTRQTRDVKGFSKIDINRGLSVTIEQSGTYFVEVEADDNLQSHITTKVENGTLVITSDESIDEATAKNINVKMPALSGVETSSGSSASTKGTFKGVDADIYIKSSSGSEATLELEFDNISCKASSGSSINLKGKALKLSTDASSGSTIEARNLLVNDVEAEASSGSATDVHPAVSLNGKASSGGSINYDSSPKTVTKDESSGGSVSKE